jgi:hypothetical protein
MKQKNLLFFEITFFCFIPKHACERQKVITSNLNPNKIPDDKVG